MASVTPSTSSGYREKSQTTANTAAAANGTSVVARASRASSTGSSRKASRTPRFEPASVQPGSPAAAADPHSTNATRPMPKRHNNARIGLRPLANQGGGSPIDGQHGAGDEGSRPGSQKDCRTRDVLRFADTPQWDGGARAFETLVAHSTLRGGGTYEAGRDGVHANTFVHHRLRKAPAHVRQSSL